ncbi:MAG: EamA family transporter [Chloroflexi bacterium]|nr:EamA family transporter [Chloroflexota bacterium]
MRKWAAFWLLGVIWGSSFMLIRVGVEELSPFQLVFIRTGIAAVGMNILLLTQRKHLPLQWRRLVPLALIGIGNTAIPFTLISVGEQTVESGLAAVLQSTTSLFALVIAHFALADERITPQKVVGLLVGFFGIVVLASRSWVDGQIVTSSLFGQLAIVAASLFYASFTTYSRRNVSGHYEPLVVAAGAMTFAAIFSGIGTIAAPYLGGQAAMPLSEVRSDIVLAAFGLGFVNTFIAYLLFYWIVPQLGAARTTMVTYVVPPVGLILGVVFLNEVLDARLLIGAAMIFAGIGFVNLPIFGRIFDRLLMRGSSVKSVGEVGSGD